VDQDGDYYGSIGPDGFGNWTPDEVFALFSSLTGGLLLAVEWASYEIT
jgi:hypothetical protein